MNLVLQSYSRQTARGVRLPTLCPWRRTGKIKGSIVEEAREMSSLLVPCYTSVTKSKSVDIFLTGR